jgi:hypothetical protein
MGMGAGNVHGNGCGVGNVVRGSRGVWSGGMRSVVTGMGAGNGMGNGAGQGMEQVRSNK